MIDFFIVNDRIRFQAINYAFDTSLKPSATENVEIEFEVKAEDFFNKPLYYVYDEESPALTE